jgi:hypothetical protein
VRVDADGVVRQEWGRQGSEADGDANPAVDGRAQYGRAPAVRDAREPPVASVERRIGEWSDRLQDLVEDEIEGGSEALSAVELIAEGLGLLQNAVDKALAGLEREMVNRFGGEIEGLHAKVAALEADWAADQKRQRAELLGLRTELAVQAKDHASEVEQWRGEITLLQTELAEQRSLDRLRNSRVGKSHAAEVQLRLVRRQLEREAKETA